MKMLTEQRIEQEKRIRDNIERRFGMIGREDKKMLNSIFERPWNKIVIEKILSTKDSTTGKKELIYEPEEVG